MAKKEIIILKTGQRLRNRRYKTIYEIKRIKKNSVVLLSEDGTGCLLIPMASITPTEYEPIYN